VADVLEIAAGTGILTRRLRVRLPAEAAIVATDLNAPMLEVAKAKFSTPENVRFEVVDALALPYADSAFDAVCCQFGVMFFPDKPRAYREARRVLRPGGRYLFSVWDAPEANPFTDVVMDALRQAFPDDTPKFFDTPFGYFAIDPIRAALHDAGFAAITVEVLPISAPLPDVRLFAEGQALGSPLADQVRTRGLDPAELVKTLTAGFRARFSAAGAMPLRAILFTAHAG
jgi:SAM-dependent methyltransferase